MAARGAFWLVSFLGLQLGDQQAKGSKLVEIVVCVCHEDWLHRKAGLRPGVGPCRSRLIEKFNLGHRSADIIIAEDCTRLSIQAPTFKQPTSQPFDESAFRRVSHAVSLR